MVKNITIREKGPVNLYFVGDLHAGAKTFAKKEFEQTIKMIRADPKGRLIGMGDYGDFIESDDTRRYDPANIDKHLNNYFKQSDYIKDRLQSIKPKIYGLLTGNHERAYAKYHKELFEKYRCPAERISRKLRVKFLEDLGIIELTIKKYKYYIVVAHGVGSSAKLAGQVNALNNILNSFNITPDIAAMGHVHSLQTIVNPKMNFKFDVNIKHLALTGNYYRTYIDGNINYASSCLYNPLPVGCVMYSLDAQGNIKDNKIIF